MKQLSAILLIVTIFFLSLPKGFAQETDPDVSAPVATTTNLKVSPDTIFLKRFRSEKTQQLLALYQDQFEKYRGLEEQYVTAKTDLHQLRTLASLETAVRATQRVMASRVEVLITYFELLHASLIESQGLELSTKQEFSDKITNQILILKDHQAKVSVAQDRDTLLQLSIEFAEINKPLQEVGYRTLAFLSISELQTVHDKSRLIFDDIQEYHRDSSPSAQTLARYQRAYVETERSLLASNQDLQKIFLDLKGNNNIKDRSSYAQVIRTLQPSYSKLSQVLGFLEELLRI